jgi:Phage shock protein A (IM30), suppresses sigma54-dependent transcription
MGILSRFKDIMASNINALVAKSRNPEKTINEYMNQMRADLGHVKSELSALELERDRAARSLNECEAEVEKYQRYSEKAAADGNSADARLYEQKKDRLMPEYESLKAKYESMEQDGSDLKQMKEKLEAEISQCEERMAAIKGKISAAKSLQEANAVESGRKKPGYTADDAFNTLEDKVNAQYDRAAAEAELNKAISSDELDDLTRKYDEV